MPNIYLMFWLIFLGCSLQVQASLQASPEEQVQSYGGFVFRYRPNTQELTLTTSLTLERMRSQNGRHVMKCTEGEERLFVSDQGLFTLGAVTFNMSPVVDKRLSLHACISLVFKPWLLKIMDPHKPCLYLIGR